MSPFWEIAEKRKGKNITNIFLALCNICEIPKLVWTNLDEGKIPRWKTMLLFHLNKNKKRARRILGRKPQGTNIHEFLIDDPCNILDFTKLVWPIFEQLKMWGILIFKAHWTMAHLFRGSINGARLLKNLEGARNWLCQVWGQGEQACNKEKSSNPLLEPFWMQKKQTKWAPISMQI